MSVGLIPRRPESVLVVVHTRALEVLLLRRIAPADFWQSVTGALRADETPAEAARREVTEETGIRDLSELQDTGIMREFPIVGPWRARYAPDATVNLEHWWTLCIADRVPVTLSPGEHTEYRWLPVREAAALASSYTNRDAILRLLAPHA